MKTAAEYRAMAEDCIDWASKAKTKEARAPLLELAQIWLDAASRLDGLPATQMPSSDEPTKSTRSTGFGT
jgi:hypothetical protein